MGQIGHSCRGRCPCACSQLTISTPTNAIAATQVFSGPNRRIGRSGSISGLCAALVAGLGVAAHSSRLVPGGLVRLSSVANLPQLPEVEFVAIGPGRTRPLAMRMVDMLVENSGSLQQMRD